MLAESSFITPKSFKRESSEIEITFPTTTIFGLRFVVKPKAADIVEKLYRLFQVNFLREYNKKKREKKLSLSWIWVAADRVRWRGHCGHGLTSSDGPLSKYITSKVLKNFPIKILSQVLLCLKGCSDCFSNFYAKVLVQ